MRKVIFFLRNLFFVLLLGLIQISFILLLPYHLNNWQIYISLLIVLLILFEESREIIWWSAILGLQLGIFSVYPIFILPLLLIAIIFFVNFALKNFITNRSWSAVFVLSIAVTFLYNLIILLTSFSFSFLVFSASNILIIPTLFTLMWQILLNSLGSLMFFSVLKNFK